VREFSQASMDKTEDQMNNIQEEIKYFVEKGFV
jgi:hypothetical protein